MGEDDEGITEYMAAGADWLRRALAAWAVVLGLGVMYAEGRVQPAPGVFFAVGFSLIVGGVLYGVRRR